MKAIVKALYNEPVLFLGVIQGLVTAGAAAHLLPAVVPLLTLAGIAPLTRYFTRPDKPVRR